MTPLDHAAPDSRDRDQSAGVLKVAILAVGGQGGGVLTDWIVDAAERSGFRAQSTSVPGVAQRTGATIYYIEMMAQPEREPVFALMPAPGDVDVVVAAELMEAGRAVTRGLVTPGRTTLIASTHRVLAVSEKIALGDGRAESGAVLDGAREAAKRFVHFDMNRIAVETGSHISASLLGALAGSGVLPIPRATFEETIRESGRGVEASLRAFAAAFARAEAEEEPAAASEDPEPPEPSERPEPPEPTGPARLRRQWADLVARVDALPAAARDMAGRGLEKVVDFQDPAYGAEYLDALERAAEAERAAGHREHRVTTELAKHLANAMAYDDVIRVADRKVRAARFERVQAHAEADADSLVHITEYMHPGAAEVCGVMPRPIGAFIEARPKLYDWLHRRVDKGRRVRTDAFWPFFGLYLLSGLRRWRRALLRHAHERAHWRSWTERALALIPTDEALAVETVRCRRLIKGYSDTHARGLSRFDRVMRMGEALEGREDAADWVRRLREAALADESGEALDGAIRTVHSFLDDEPPAARG